MNKPRRFYLISLGCPKNLVDSAGLATLLQRAGYTAADEPEEADLLIVNTCGFIAPAREESLDVLHELAQGKRPGQRIIAAGCYSQRFPDELAESVPGIDGLISTRRWMDIVSLVERLEGTSARRPICHLPETPTVGQDALDVPRVAAQGASAYLKLADGCRRSCAFCAIPLIKGTAVSRPPDDILADAVWLAERGVRELVLIAQDTTDYGHDLGMRDGLSDLLERLVAAAPEVDWIRLMYAYPGRVTERLIETMARHPQILPYLDIPLQHAHPGLLRRMRRPSDVGRVRRTVERLRAAMPEIAIRTTFLVGFPGESGAEFRALLNFVAEMEFDRVGVFTYSHEAGVPAAALADDVPPEVKEERRERLMAVQQPISLAKNQALVGRTLDVLIEGQGEGLSVGRSYRDAPEIDGLVLVQDEKDQRVELLVGEIVPVRITAALEYDLVGSPVFV
ncbi:MAG: ribosomal protein S12 methylthiotransferase RimO [Anaerolineaceae bacterium 4572_32.2]|nr:MAG: ribosomal protein S12 methylthiotransferase RimO [Anaerolineaceae bacterium 4572_32.2]HEY73684.1 30S ribosomal protein S12 methylthiotransferase RimO [Thermoflexia bacterium]